MFQNKRIEELEKRVKELEENTKISVFTGFNPWNMWSYKSVPVNEVVKKIMERVGLELKYHNGQPERLSVEKKSKKKG